jgi:zinc protease
VSQLSKFVPLAALALPMAMPAYAAPRKQAPSKSDVLPFKATEKQLPNGLKVIVVPTGFPNLVSVTIPVQTGSRNEVEPGKSGFAHFFEHMMFRGTKTYPPEKYQDIITKAGARQNAYTSDDLTNYYTTFAKQDLETVLKVEADRFQHLDYSEAAFKTESRAVLGEYNKNSANPMQKLFEAQRDAAFNTHTYKHTTMGFLKDIEDMPNQYQYSKTFFDRWYRPERTTIIIAGDVDPKSAIALVEKYWSGWKRGSYKVAVPAEPAPQGAQYRHVNWPSPTLPLVTVAFRAPAFSDTKKDQAALSMLLSLSFGRTSSLYKRLVQDEQKVDQLFDYTPARVDPSLVTDRRARQEAGRCALRTQRHPRDGLEAARHPGHEAGPGRRAVVGKIRPDPHPGQHGHGRPDPGFLRPLRPLLRHDQPLLPPDRHPDPGRPAGRRAQIPGR